MNTKTYNRFKALLIKACDKHIKAGNKIISGSFTDDDFDDSNKGYCPMTCVLGKPINDGAYFEALNKKLKTKVSDTDYWNFIEGFDGNVMVDLKRSKSRLFKLGRALRQKYLNGK
jgi:hypothetical protein